MLAIKKNSKRILFDSKHLKVIDDNGWEFVERKITNTSAAIIAITDNKEIILIEQFRPPVKSICLELPGGLVGDSNGLELPIAAAKRELLEETGFRAHQLEQVAKVALSPGMISEIMHIFKATQLEKFHDGGGIDNEEIKVIKVPIANLLSFIDSYQHVVNGNIMIALSFLQNI